MSENTNKNINNINTVEKEKNNLEITNTEATNTETTNIETTNIETTNIETNNIEANNTETDNTEIDNIETDNKDLIPVKKIIIRSLRILFTIGFVVFSALFINEVIIQPYKLKKSIDKARELYNSTEAAQVLDRDQDMQSDKITEDNIEENNSDILIEPTPTKDPNRDEMGRLIKFKKLLEVNEDVKGWIRIDNINGENDTKIDYVVVQSDPKDPEYYLTRDWATKEYLKAGSIFLDHTSSVETNTQNLIIHGHNMTSSDDMFHYLLKYKELKFLKEHPIIKFDTIYEEGLWKVFSVFITPGNNDKGDFFRFNRSVFQNNRDFLEFVYQVRLRSLFNIDDVDISDDDQILTLSTCSYELDNYRIIIVARKVRDGEDVTVDTDSIKKNENVLFPDSFYKHYGGEAPVSPTFEAALQDGLIPWYNPMGR